MTSELEKRARRPVSYAGASDTGTCDGWQASPSNPTEGSKKSNTRKHRELDAVVVFRCSGQEKQALIDKAERAGLPFASLIREALGLTDSRRRKSVPRVDPELIRAVSRIGSNVNQIARALNQQAASDDMSDIDALAVAVQLVTIDRHLSKLVAEVSPSSGHHLSWMGEPHHAD